MSKTFSFAIRTCALTASWLATSTLTSAAIINLGIDSSQSSVSLTGGAFGLAYNPQGPGSMTTTLSGTITADLNAGVFTFSGGSSIVFGTNPNGPYSSAPNPESIIPGNYGVTANGVVSPFGNVVINGVYRNLTLDVTAGTAENGSAMSGGVMKFTGGQIVFGAATEFAGNVPGLSNITSQGNNTAGGLVSWDGTTLSFPVLFATTGSNGRFENWTGTVVARVPEPSSLGMVISLVGLISFARKRRN